MKILRPYLLAAFLVAAPEAARAFAPADLPRTTNVVDETSILTAEETAQIDRTIGRLQNEKSIFAAVYLVRSLGGESIESAAVATFEKWKLGQKGRDNGLLFIFAIRDRKARIEVGYGLEGDITDLRSKRTLDETILPDFKQAEYARGILKGLHALGDLPSSEGVDLSGPEPRSGAGAPLLSEDEARSGANRYLGWLAILFVFPALVRIYKISRGKYDMGKPTPGFFGAPASKWRALRFLHLDTSDKLFLKLFLAVNPGAFIYFSGAFLPPSKIDELLETAKAGLVSGRLWMQVAVFAWTAAAAAAWFLLVFACFVASFAALPLLMRAIGSLLGSAGRNKNPVLRLKGKAWFAYVFGDLDAAPLYFYCFVSFFAALVFMGESLGALNLFAGPYLLYAAALAYSELAPLISPRAYELKMARARLHRIQTRVEGTRWIFGKLHTYSARSSNSNWGGSSRGGSSSSSSSGSSSSSSFSSSSGGGGSGGGGASSSW